MVRGEGKQETVTVVQGRDRGGWTRTQGVAISKRCCHAHFLAEESSPGFLTRQLSFHCQTSSAPATGLDVGVPSHSNASINSPLTCETASNEKQCQDMNESFGKPQKEVRRNTEKETGMNRWVVSVAECRVGSMH